MFEAFLANSSVEGLRPLGTAPQRSFELITGTVREKFTDRHAALFAEPVAAEHGERFDWYATTAGRPVALTELDEEDAGRAREVLDGLVADITGAADELLASKDANDQRLGEALANALQVPDDTSIFVLKDEAGSDALQPVLVNWAWVRDEQAVVRGVLTGTDKRAPSARPGAATVQAAAAVSAPVAAVADERAGRSGLIGALWWLIWLGWLLLALLIAWLIYLLIEPCALRLPWTPDACPQVAEKGLTLIDERKALENQIAQVEKAIAMDDRACQPDIATLPIPEPPVQSGAVPVEPNVDERAAAVGAQQGDLTFTVIWDGRDDLDLHLTCPSAQTLFFMTKELCNGVLDVDSNAQDISPNPIENAYFTDPLPGSYSVRVHFYKDRDGLAVRPFTLQIRDGDKIMTHRGTVSKEAPHWNFEYRYEGK